MTLALKPDLSLASSFTGNSIVNLIELGHFYEVMRVILTLVALISVCVGNSPAAEVRVFAAASLTDVLKEIAADYEKSTGDKVVFNFAGSNFLARQIEAGAPADIFFSADEAQMDRVQKLGLIVAGTRRDRLSNSLVIVVAKENTRPITSGRDLTNAEIKRVALADPAGVPAGIYAKGYLEKQGLWKALSEKIVPTENVRAALAAVESGNVEAAIVYKTDAAISKHTKIAFEIPPADTLIRYPVAVLTDSKQRIAATKVIDHLFSPAATSVFQKYEFVAN
jgi:molybdate transport system substrate-binding protein